MRFTDFVSRLSRELALADLRPGADGSAGVQIDGVPIALTPDEEGRTFTVRARLGAMARDDISATAREILSANLFPGDLPCAMLSVDMVGDVYMIQRFDCETLSFERFLAALSRFVMRGAPWQTRLEGNTGAPSQPAAGVAAPFA